MKRVAAAVGACALLAALPAPLAAAEPASTSCTVCHSDPAWFEADALALVASEAAGVHAARGLSCHDCHGGNPDPALADDLAAAMDEGYEPNPFRGVPGRGEIPGLCGRCHSDPAYMRRFNPAPRVDQVEEYATSQHGMLLAQGDERVATCVDCHHAHGVLGPAERDSPVHPRNVAETCRGCHGDPDYMAPYRLPDGRPLPVDQYARWRRSVHAAALLDKEDLSAPTCNDCHGNHGALPPGLDSISYVCGQCHGREADLFRASAKREGFQEHNELLAAAGDEGCAACHVDPEPQAAQTAIRSFTQCSTCHGNHGVVRPTVAMLAPLPETPCALCHAGPGAPANAAAADLESIRVHVDQVRSGLLAQAADQGLTGEGRFDWLVDQALALPEHNLAGDGGERQPRPEFDRLFQKFRIGRTYTTFEDPVSGETVRTDVVRCSDCHAEEPMLAASGVGYRTGAELVAHMQELTSRTANAERLLLAARHGGVEVRAPAAEIDQAVDAQIELEVLVHAFSTAEDGAFRAKAAEGLGHAQAAAAGAHRALDELAFRRRGLVVSLGLIALALVALALKIRQISRF